MDAPLFSKTAERKETPNETLRSLGWPILALLYNRRSSSQTARAFALIPPPGNQLPRNNGLRHRALED